MEFIYLLFHLIHQTLTKQQLLFNGLIVQMLLLELLLRLCCQQQEPIPVMLQMQVVCLLLLQEILPVLLVPSKKVFRQKERELEMVKMIS